MPDRLDTQAPLRARISVLADQFIHDSWGNGRTVNKESSSRFAVEILLYVRMRFYAEIEKDGKHICTLIIHSGLISLYLAPHKIQLAHYTYVNFGIYTEPTRYCFPCCWQ